MVHSEGWNEVVVVSWPVLRYCLSICVRREDTEMSIIVVILQAENRNQYLPYTKKE
jgi:hypothetical protein